MQLTEVTQVPEVIGGGEVRAAGEGMLLKPGMGSDSWELGGAMGLLEVIIGKGMQVGEVMQFGGRGFVARNYRGKFVEENGSPQTNRMGSIHH